MQVYNLAYELRILDINQVFELPLDVYRGWVIWLNKRNKEAQRKR